MQCAFMVISALAYLHEANIVHLAVKVTYKQLKNATKLK